MGDLKSADREVEDIVKRSGTSFYQGMRILPRERRRAMYGIYAFCRVVDDIADEPAPAEKKQAELEAWRSRIAQLYRGRPSDAITTVLSYAVADYGLRQEDFLAIIDGMETDAKTQVVAPSWDDLDLYCDQVASAVGRLSVRAFGDGSKRADDVAWALGRALQFTNILRDIKEDAERGRMYLPGGWLRDAGVKLTIAIRMADDPNLPKVCERMARQAHLYFKQAEAAMDDCDKKAMRPARMMASSYKAQLAAMERRGWKKLSKPVKVPKWRKLLIVLRHTVL
jgi:phytoene synthase